MKKLMAIALMVAMILSLVACGGDKAPGGDKPEAEDPVLGRYEAISVDIIGWTDFSEVYEGESYLELGAGGKGTMVVDGDKIDFKYTVEDGNLSMDAEGYEAKGTIKDGVVVTGFFMFEEIKMVFAKEGVTVPAEYLPGAVSDDTEETAPVADDDIQADDSVYAKTEDLNGKFMLCGEYVNGEYYYGEGMGHSKEDLEKTFVVFNGDGTGTYSWYVEEEDETGEMTYSVENQEYVEDGFFDCKMIPVGDYIYIQYTDTYYCIYCPEGME